MPRTRLLNWVLKHPRRRLPCLLNTRLLPNQVLEHFEFDVVKHQIFRIAPNTLVKQLDVVEPQPFWSWCSAYKLVSPSKLSSRELQFDVVDHHHFQWSQCQYLRYLLPNVYVRFISDSVPCIRHVPCKYIIISIRLIKYFPTEFTNLV